MPYIPQFINRWLDQVRPKFPISDPFEAILTTCPLQIIHHRGNTPVENRSFIQIWYKLTNYCCTTVLRTTVVTLEIAGNGGLPSSSTTAAATNYCSFSVQWPRVVGSSANLSLSMFGCRCHQRQVRYHTGPKFHSKNKSSPTGWTAGGCRCSPCRSQPHCQFNHTVQHQ